MKETTQTWYKSLKRSRLTPPDWVFAPAWIFLYITILISFILIVKDGHILSKIPRLLIFFIQLGLNILWPKLFFEDHLIKEAMIDIILLWASILLMIISFWNISIFAALILIPYLLWVSFATYLNYKIFVLN